MDALFGYLKVAASVAQAAADRLLADRGRGATVRSEIGKDIKIDADDILDQVICEGLRRDSAFPILSEESGDGSLADDRAPRWIVDPLDGSLNFSRGIPFFCISIALWQGMTPLLGVIHDVERCERFTGIVGAGAWLNGRPIGVSGVREKSRAVLCTGFPVKSDHGTDAVRAFIEAVQIYKKVRLLGSAALSLAYVACGRADAYRENDIAIWDVAAGAALVRAAAGVVQLAPTGRGEHTLTVEATNGVLGRAPADPTRAAS